MSGREYRDKVTLVGLSGPSSVSVIGIDPNGVVTGEVGDLLVRNDAGNASLFQNTDGAMAWQQIGLGSLPPLAGVEGAVLVEDPVGTLIFRRLTEDDIDPAFSITSFAHSPTAVQVSETVTTPAFTASYVRSPPLSAILTDNGGTLPQDVTSTPLAFSSTGTFQKNAYGQSVTLQQLATDPVTGDPATANLTITWEQFVYWGADVAGLSTGADIQSLSSHTLTNTKNRTFSATAGAGQYIYYAYRTGYGPATFTVGGFEGGFDLISTTIAVTNGFGFTENYTLYRSTNANLGATNVTVT